VHPRLPLIASITALLVAVFGSTSLGHAALDAVPFAKSSGYAKLSGNAKKLNGRKSTLSGAPGTIPVVASNGKLPASIGAVGPQGQKGENGKNGKDGKDATALWARVTAGALVGSGPNVVAAHPSKGRVTLTFPKDVSKCGITTGINVIAANFGIVTDASGPTVTVATFTTPTGTNLDIPFSVAIFC
jgi:hypothetical protein